MYTIIGWTWINKHPINLDTPFKCYSNEHNFTIFFVSKNNNKETIRITIIKLGNSVHSNPFFFADIKFYNKTTRFRNDSEKWILTASRVAIQYLQG